MSASATHRRKAVLRAIVADYIATQEPVGSKSLVERHAFQYSSATIRNDMAALEAEGYISQPHTSSGRIPLEKAYRFFVDSLDLQPLSKPQRAAIARFLESSVDTQDVIARSARLLSQLTQQTAVVQLPTLTVATIKHVEVVELNPTLLLIVVVSSTGRVDQCNVSLSQPVVDVATLKLVLNQALSGATLVEAEAQLATLELGPAAAQDPALHRCVEVLRSSILQAAPERLVIAGTARTPSPEVLDALEEQVVMLRLLSHIHHGEVDGNVRVIIGGESGAQEMAHASVVGTAYGGTNLPFGGMGVVGPTCMDYQATMSKVQAVASYVSQMLGKAQ